MIRHKTFPSRSLLASWQWSLPTGWVAGLRTGLLIWLIVLGHKPSFAPAWLSPASPLGTESNRPLESELPTESQESTVVGEYLFHGQRTERSLAGDRAGCKLPPNHLTNHISRGRGFLMAESCFGSEHGLRNGTGSHLRC
jgi:hypothetical protein